MTERLPFLLRAYQRLGGLGPLVAPILLSRRLKRSKEHPQRLRERRGQTAMPRPPGPLIWAHGASVGEILAAIPLADRIRSRGYNVLVTSGTLTSADVALRRLPKGVLHQFIPLDVPRYVRRFLDHWQPNLALFVEGELWPNFILQIAARRIPLVLVNGRLSKRSFSRWRRLPAVIGALLSRFDLCLAQSPDDAARYATLGAPRVRLTGNLKLDVPAPPVDPAELDALKAVIRKRPVFAAASTHPGEEAVIAAVHRRVRESCPSLLTVIIPRHPERGPGIVEIAQAAGLRAMARSAGQVPARITDIYVADTIGELGLFYRLAPIVFMGGSLVRHGGQNPIEAAKLGAAILHGPHVWNFADLYGTLDQIGGATLVQDGDELIAAMTHWLSNGAARQEAADVASEKVSQLGGALERTLGAIDPYLMQLRLERR